MLFCLLAVFSTVGASGYPCFKTNYATQAWQYLNQTPARPTISAEVQAQANENLKSAELLFLENNGQVANDKGKPLPEVLFTAKAAGAQVYVTATSIHYVFTKVDLARSTRAGVSDFRRDSIKSVTTHRFTVELVGANPSATLIKNEPQLYFENHYLAHCPAGVQAMSYKRFTLKDVYPGVDWVVYSHGQNLKYDFVLAKGSDASKIKLRVKDAGSSIGKSGSLVMTTSLGKVEEEKPVSFQHGQALSTRFKALGHQTYGFEVSGMNTNAPLTIDPNVVWSTYYGGSGYETSNACVSDFSGNVYLAGATASMNLPVSGTSYQPTFAGSVDAFIVKLSNSGTRLWATYYGGSSDEDGLCTLDPQGNLYIAGFTNSVDFPVSGAFQPSSAGGQDAFLLKLDSFGARLWATYYGGTSRDQGRVCTTDALGNVYFSGLTASVDFPVRGAVQPSANGRFDSFLVKFTASGAPLWSTYFGGTEDDVSWSCATDGLNNVYLTGTTSSANFPVTPGAFQPGSAGNRDAYLAKFGANGTLIWSTYYGGTSIDDAISCITDLAGNVYMAGPTGSADFPVSNAFQATYAGGISDAFLVKFTSTGTRLWATFYGGNDVEDCSSCVVDALGYVYITGETSSTQFPVTAAAYQTTYGGSTYDAYLVQFNTQGQRLWASYYGGDGLDIGNFCSADGLGNVYLAGATTSTNLPTVGASQSANAGGFDAFVTRLSNCAVLVKPTISRIGDTTFCAGDSVVLTAPSGYAYLWSSGANTQSITITTTGRYSVRIIDNGCGSEVSDPVPVQVTPSPQLPTITANRPTAFCVGDSVRLTAPTGFSYLWSTSDTTQSIMVKNPGTYTLKTSSGLCSSPVASLVVMHLLNDTLRLDHNLGTVCPGTTSTYRYSVRSRNIYPFTWTVEGGIIQVQDSNWVNVLWSTTAASYRLKVSAITNALCYIYPDSLTFTILSTSTDPLSSCYVPSAELKIPNVITPNDDKMNDALIINGIDQYPASQLTLYNRYGVQMATYAPYQNQFTGKDLAAGTYFIVLNSGTGYVYKGWLEVVR